MASSLGQGDFQGTAGSFRRESTSKSMLWSQLARVHLLSLPASSGVCTQLESDAKAEGQPLVKPGQARLPSPATLPSSTTRLLQGAGSPLPVHPAGGKRLKFQRSAGPSRHSPGACFLVCLTPGHDPKCSTSS